MLKPEPLPKDRRRVPIPEDLRDDMREVWELVQQAKHDRDVSIDFDDAIQVGGLCGGRTGEKKRPFEFTYSPRGDEKRGRWYLTLHPLEIEDIADGRMTDILMYCCTSPDCRCKFRAQDELCSFCDYQPDPVYARLPLAEALPRLEASGIRGLSIGATRSDVIALLGEPQEAGGGLISHSVHIEPWILYHRPTGLVRFGFDPDGRVREVTFMPSDWKPGT
jgi:hypothetical protein